MRTELQKKIVRIIRNTKIASWQKCEEIEQLFAVYTEGAKKQWAN